TGAKTAAAAKAEKPEAKAAAKPADKPVRRGGRKPKELTVEDICAKITKRAAKAKAALIDGTIAAEFKIYGWENNDENHKFIYIEVKDGKLTVAPYSYDDCTLKADIPLADIAAFAEGKIALKDAKIYAAGNFGDALKLASIFE
ncbi:MAG: SCP2 sterol-binding domain-containing protein, partial [Oscillospiraceae bacterium]|nr:SCP2 sterol-binding domain-containing protein [Oscillospiraceae bacterium]